MELCITQSISTLPKNLTTNTNLLRSTPCLPFQLPATSIRRHSNLHSRFVLVTRATYEDKPSGYYGGSSSYTTTEVVESTPTVEKSANGESSVTVEQSPKEESTASASDSGDSQVNELLDSLNIKIDTEDTYSLVLYGSAALVALWLVIAVVRSIDSIPLIPKLMEVVGLGYTLWFTIRYLLFKESRNELSAKIEELKEQVLGSGDD